MPFVHPQHHCRVPPFINTESERPGYLLLDQCSSAIQQSGTDPPVLYLYRGATKPALPRSNQKKTDAHPYIRVPYHHTTRPVPNLNIEHALPSRLFTASAPHPRPPCISARFNTQLHSPDLYLHRTEPSSPSFLSQTPASLSVHTFTPKA